MINPILTHHRQKLSSTSTYPAAHPPAALPDLSLHSVELKQVPFLETVPTLKYDIKIYMIVKKNLSNNEKTKPYRIPFHILTC